MRESFFYFLNKISPEIESTTHLLLSNRWNLDAASQAQEDATAAQVTYFLFSFAFSTVLSVLPSSNLIYVHIKFLLIVLSCITDTGEAR